MTPQRRAELLAQARQVQRHLRDEQILAGRRKPRTRREMELFLAGTRERFDLPGAEEEGESDGEPEPAA
jgi:hypothetical protein